MKSVSAAIIVVVAAALLFGGTFIAHDDTALFIQVIGCIVGIVGIAGWVMTLRLTNSIGDSE